MLGRWRVRVPSRRARGWRRGGRGSAPFFASLCRSPHQFAEAEALSAIVNGNRASFVLPHHHATATRRPVPTLPFQLQQTIVITHHPVFTHHTFLLQPKHLVQLPYCRSPPMIVSRFRCSAREAPVVLGNVVLLQKAVGFRVAGDPAQPQLLDQPVLMRAVIALHSSFGLRRAGGDDPNPQLLAHAPELRHRYRAFPLFAFGRSPHVYVLPV